MNAGLIGACAVVVVLILGAGIFYASKLPETATDKGQLPPESSSFQGAPASANPAAPDVEIKTWSFSKTRGLPGESTYEVSAKVANHTDSTYRVVWFDMALYSKKGEIVASSVIPVQNLGAHGTGVASGYVIDKTNTTSPKGELSFERADE